MPNVPMHSSKLKLEIKCLRSTKILNEKVIAFPADLRDSKRGSITVKRGCHKGVVTYLANMCVCGSVCACVS